MEESGPLQAASLEESSSAHHLNSKETDTASTSSDLQPWQVNSGRG